MQYACRSLTWLAHGHAYPGWSSLSRSRSSPWPKPAVVRCAAAHYVLSEYLTRAADVSVEQVAQLAQQNALPEPTLDLSTLSAPSTLARQPAVYAADDPWHTSGFTAATPVQTPGVAANGAGPSLAGSGLPKTWWARQERVAIKFAGQQGFILNRYMLYEVTTEVRLIWVLLTWALTIVIEGRAGVEAIFRIRVLVGLLGPALSVPIAGPAASQAYRTCVCFALGSVPS
jgi:hypothetical protein